MKDNWQLLLQIRSVKSSFLPRDLKFVSALESSNYLKLKMPTILFFIKVTVIRTCLSYLGKMQVLTCVDFYCILIFVLRQIDKVSSFICFVFPMNAS